MNTLAIKSGDLISVGNQVLFDRIQSGGPGQINIQTDKIYELGNYQSVGTVLNTPDLSYTLESFDVSTETESLLVGSDYLTDVDGHEYDMNTCLPLDVAGQFKKGKSDANKYDAPFSVLAPHLVVESLSYKFGFNDNTSLSVSLKGDSLFYNPGSTYIEMATGTNTPNQAVVLAHPAFPYNGDTNTGVRYVLEVSLKSGQRLRYGVDYTETVGAGVAAKAVTVTVLAAVKVTDQIRVAYTSDAVANYPQASHAVASALRPAAVRGRDVLVYIGGKTDAFLWTGVQTATVDWKATLEKDEEMGNHTIVEQDYDVPEVNGSITIKPKNPADLLKKLQVITGVATLQEAIGAMQRVPLPLYIVIKSPVTGAVLKTLHVPDAKFTLPGFQGRVQQKLTLDLNYESDGGVLLVNKGARP